MMSICICNLGLYNEGKLACEWLVLPFTQDKLQRLLHRIGINEVYEEWFICDSSCDLVLVNEIIGEHTSVHSLNRLAEHLQGLSESDLEMLEAVAEYESPRTTDELLKLACNLDCYTLYPDVNTREELGEYFLCELEAIYVPEHLLPYFDAEAYGRDLSFSLDGLFTSAGFVEKIDEPQEIEC